MRVPENNFVEVNFEKRIKIETIADKPVTIVQYGNMTTKFGRKEFALLEDGKWFYINSTLDHLLDLELPATVTITMIESKNGTKYWTSDAKQKSVFPESVHITDLVGQNIIVYNMRLVDTKFGERVAIDFTYFDDPEQTKYSSLTRWTNLFDYVADELDGDFDTLKDDPLYITVIEKHSRSNPDHVYQSYKNFDPDAPVTEIKTKSINKPSKIKPLNKKRS